MLPSRSRTRRAAPAAVAFAGLGLIVAGCSGFGGDERAGLSCVDDSPECVDQRQTTLKSMLADQDRKWVKESDHAAGACLRRPAVRLPQPQEGAQLRGAGASAGARLTAPPSPCAGRRARGCHRRRSRAPPCSPPRSARNSPPRCGPPLQSVRPAAAARRRCPLECQRPAFELRPDRQMVGADGGPGARRPTRRARTTRRCGRAPPAAARIGHAGQLGISIAGGTSPVPLRSARNALDQGEVLRSPASTSGPRCGARTAPAPHLPLVQPWIAARPMERACRRWSVEPADPIAPRRMPARPPRCTRPTPEASSGRRDSNASEQRQLAGALDMVRIDALAGWRAASLARAELGQHDDVGGRRRQIAARCGRVIVCSSPGVEGQHRQRLLRAACAAILVTAQMLAPAALAAAQRGRARRARRVATIPAASSSSIRRRNSRARLAASPRADEMAGQRGDDIGHRAEAAAMTTAKAQSWPRPAGQRHPPAP